MQCEHSDPSEASCGYRPKISRCVSASHKLALIFADTLQDLDTSISDLATKFMKTDVKNLEDELAHHDLQSRFDIQATAKLTKWETLVRSLQHHIPFTNKLQPAGTHRAVCNKQGLQPSCL